MLSNANIESLKLLANVGDNARRLRELQLEIVTCTCIPFLFFETIIVVNFLKTKKKKKEFQMVGKKCGVNLTFYTSSKQYIKSRQEAH